MNDKTITCMKKHPRMVVLISVAANVLLFGLPTYVFHPVVSRFADYKPSRRGAASLAV